MSNNICMLYLSERWLKALRCSDSKSSRVESCDYVQQTKPGPHSSIQPEFMLLDLLAVAGLLLRNPEAQPVQAYNAREKEQLRPPVGGRRIVPGCTRILNCAESSHTVHAADNGCGPQRILLSSGRATTTKHEVEAGKTQKNTYGHGLAIVESCMACSSQRVDFL